MADNFQGRAPSCKRQVWLNLSAGASGCPWNAVCRRQQRGQSGRSRLQSRCENRRFQFVLVLVLVLDFTGDFEDEDENEDEGCFSKWPPGF
jgi:hypothetical protein